MQILHIFCFSFATLKRRFLTYVLDKSTYLHPRFKVWFLTNKLQAESEIKYDCSLSKTVSFIFFLRLGKTTRITSKMGLIKSGRSTEIAKCFSLDRESVKLTVPVKLYVRKTAAHSLMPDQSACGASFDDHLPKQHNNGILLFQNSINYLECWPPSCGNIWYQLVLLQTKLDLLLFQLLLKTETKEWHQLITLWTLSNSITLLIKSWSSPKS